MKNDVRKQPLEAALRAVIDSLIERSNLAILKDFADGIGDGLADGTVADTDKLNKLYDELHIARMAVRDDRDRALHLKLAMARWEGETEAEHEARLRLWGMSDD